MALAAVGLLLVSAAAIGLAVISTRRARRATDELERLSQTDLLTGLPNREAFERDLEGLLASSRAAGRRITVLLFELNRYAIINETYGHEIGDTLMTTVVTQMRAALGDRPMYRYSGPQFAILYDDVGSIDAAKSRAAELQHTLDVPFSVQRDRIRLTASMGFMVTDADADDWHEVLLDAVIALQEANERGAGSVVSYELALRDRMNPITAEKRLRAALDEGQFSLVYMPLVKVWDNSVVGVEALLRWADPDRGGAMIAPGEFLKALDETGLIVPVGGWVIAEACRQMAAWQKTFAGRDLTMTVNVSPRQMAQADFAETLGAAIEESGVDPEHLCIEITEGNMWRDVDEAWGSMRNVKKLGVQLALDDFGTGYASLAYMRQFELDVVKIDPVFVRGLGKNREDEAMVQQIIGLAHSLGITAVGEGVDAEVQAETLRSLQCDLAQGYYFSRPQPVDVVERLIAKGKVVPGESEKKSVDWSGGGVPVSPDVLSN